MVPKASFTGVRVVDPQYRQIAEDLRRQIESDELPPGAQLQTELELREEYGASRNTIRYAMKWLITRGLVEARPGRECSSRNGSIRSLPRCPRPTETSRGYSA